MSDNKMKNEESTEKKPENLLSTEATPDGLNAGSANKNWLSKLTLFDPGVKRLSKLPIIIISSILGTFVVSLCVGAYMINARQRDAAATAAQPPSSEAIGNAGELAHNVIGQQGAGTYIAPNKDAGPNDIYSGYGGDGEIVAAANTAASGPRLQGEDTMPLPPIARNLDGSQSEISPSGAPPRGLEGAQRLDDPVAQQWAQWRNSKALSAQEATPATNFHVPESSDRNSSAYAQYSATKGTGYDSSASANSELEVYRQRLNALKNTDPSEAYSKNLARAQELIASNAISSQKNSSLAASLTPTSTGSGTSAFTTTGGQATQKNRFSLSTQLQPPASPYILHPGMVIPGTLITGLNSDLPGQMIAQVSENVYDTPTGNYLLIPQGSKLIGAYNSGILWGQERVLIAWQQIVYPDGSTLDIGSMPGADLGGASGMKDQVNNHYVRLFGSAFLMSGIVGAVAYATTRSQNYDNPYAPQSLSSTLAQTLGQSLGQATVELLQKNMGIAPTIELRPGLRLNVIVTKSLQFAKPYKAFEWRTAQQ